MFVLVLGVGKFVAIGERDYVLSFKFLLSSWQNPIDEVFSSLILLLVVQINIQDQHGLVQQSQNREQFTI